MLDNHYGTIINMTSIAGLVAGGAAYTASKAGIIGYTMTMLPKAFGPISLLREQWELQ